MSSQDGTPADPVARRAAVEAAVAAAAAAARRAGARLAGLEEVTDLVEAARLWQRVWGRRGESPVPPELLRALGHAGNYLAAAYVDGAMTGALLGFYAGAASPDHLHSHILGVDPRARARGVGFALKQHQRAWALERGIERVAWTYDPLVRANGFFNLVKLGADGTEYLVDFYGQLPDGINGADDSDRVLITWDLLGARASAAAAGGGEAGDEGRWLAAGAHVALDIDDAGAPVVVPGVADVVLCRTPLNIVALRRTRPDSARAWRAAMREVLVAAVGRGLTMTGMTTGGAYVLEPARARARAQPEQRREALLVS